jgi:perosamine synthetase
MNWKIPLFKIYWDEEDIKSVTEAIEAGMNWAAGPKVEELEGALKEYVGSKYCVAFNSGTSALHAALMAHGVGPGKEVIVPSFTFIATANSPLFVGARPIFADIEHEFFGLDPEDVKEKITRRTAAIIPIHYGGCPCKIRELKEIAEDHKLLLIEDAAEALGAKMIDKNVGSFGDSAMFSFCQNKIVTTGEGGAITTDSQSLNERLRLIRSHGRLETSDYFTSIEINDYITLGYNFRLSNLIAALGVSQLRKADKIIKLRRENAEYLTSKISREIKEIRPQTCRDDRYCVYQMYTIEAEERDDLMRYLAESGIMTKVYFSPVHHTHFYKKVLGYEVNLPVTEDLSSRVLTLPFYPAMAREEMDYVVHQIRGFYDEI